MRKTFTERREKLFPSGWVKRLWKNKKFKALLIILVLVKGCGVHGCYGPYRGTVTDSQTGQPIEGAVVMAKYKRYWWGPGGPGADPVAKATEAVTNKNGEFFIWPTNAFTYPLPLLLIAGGYWPMNPEFVALKEGYLMGKYYPGVKSQRINEFLVKCRFELDSDNISNIQIDSMNPKKFFDTPEKATYYYRTVSGAMVSMLLTDIEKSQFPKLFGLKYIAIDRYYQKIYEEASHMVNHYKYRPRQ